MYGKHVVGDDRGRASWRACESVDLSEGRTSTVRRGLGCRMLNRRQALRQITIRRQAILVARLEWWRSQGSTVLLQRHSAIQGEVEDVPEF